ncbi:MAG: peptide deformylase [Parcubacteria group bacterium]|nr:peptide deformylase [Parcubacteria group bacterium]
MSMAYTPHEPQVLSIVECGDPILRWIAKEVKDFNNEGIQAFIDDMILTAASVDGVGLAAPQVGVSLRIIVVAPTGKGQRALINPRITHLSSIRKIAVEGCLSIPGNPRKVKRSNRITASFQDRFGTHLEETFTGLEARIVQHEIDHLNGVLITDK